MGDEGVDVVEVAGAGAGLLVDDFGVGWGLLANGAEFFVNKHEGGVDEDCVVIEELGLFGGAVFEFADVHLEFCGFVWA